MKRCQLQRFWWSCLLLAGCGAQSFRPQFKPAAAPTQTVVLADSDAEAAAKAERLGVDNTNRPTPAQVIVGGPDTVAEALRPYVDAGAEWLMLGPIDSSDPENCRIIGAELAPRLRQ